MSAKSSMLAGSVPWNAHSIGSRPDLLRDVLMLVSRFIHPSVVPVMLTNNITQPSVGADLSCPSPMYRPLVGISNSMALHPSKGNFPAVGARVVGSGWVGLYGRPLFPKSSRSLVVRPSRPCSASLVVRLV